jgi:hypothetical protein
VTDVTIGQLRHMMLTKGAASSAGAGMGLDPGWPFLGKIVATANKWNLELKPLISDLPDCENPTGLLYANLLSKVEQAKKANLFVQRAAANPYRKAKHTGYSDYND